MFNIYLFYFISVSINLHFLTLVLYFCCVLIFLAEVPVPNGIGYESYPGYSMVVPYTNQRFKNGNMVTLSNGFEISTMGDSRYIEKNMYGAYPWGSNGFLLEEPAVAYDFLYNKTAIDAGLVGTPRVIDEHDALRQALLGDKKRLKRYLLFTFEDRLNHELVLGGKSRYHLNLTGLVVEKKIGVNTVKSNMYHRISWTVVTDNRVLEDKNEDDHGLNAMNDLLAGMPTP